MIRTTGRVILTGFNYGAAMKAAPISALYLLIPILATGATWTVRIDGTGHYTEIQDAINIAATGDSILIGPGRYDQFRHYTYGMQEWDVVASAEGKALVITGSGDTTIIGPEYVDNLEYSNTVGIYSDSNINIHNLIVEKTYAGIMLTESVSVVENITALDCWHGIHASSYANCTIRSCKMNHCREIGILMTLVESPSYVDSCIFINNSSGIDVDYMSNGVILSNSNFIDNTLVGIQYATRSTGVINNCHVNGSNTGISVAVETDVEINNTSSTQVTYWGLKVVNGSRVFGSGNIIHGAGTYAAIQCCLSSMDITESHILRDQGYAVELFCVYPPGYPLPLELSGNYWGTSSADSIAAWIWDGNDDPTIPVTVQYLPFYGSQVSNENMSFGEIKAMFRR
jgi:Right handed beta helix region